MGDYEIFSMAPDPAEGHKPEPIYRDGGEPSYGTLKVEALEGEINGEITNMMNIAYTLWGDKGPIVLFLHGVPTNRRQYYPMQKLMSPFCRTISIDMLGMGESDKPKNYESWLWRYDTGYIQKVMRKLFGDEQFFFFADDWGGGILAHYASLAEDDLLGVIYLDPIALDEYPVPEIQAIGRASQLSDEQFQMAMGAADQTFIQIFKTMTYDPNKWNQYFERDILFPYSDQNYEVPGASSLSMTLNFDSLRVLADRAAVLAPEQLLPYDRKKNPGGVDYSVVEKPVLVLWGEYDNMMPTNQGFRLAHLYENADVDFIKIPRAGHFAGIDQPELVSEYTLLFIQKVVGPSGLADAFLGFTGIWKGDERRVRSALNRKYGN